MKLVNGDHPLYYKEENGGDMENTSGETGRRYGLVVAGIGLLIVVAVVAMLFIRRNIDQNTEMTAEELELSNFGLVAIAPYDPTQSKSGNVLISNDALREYDANGLKGFYVFGDRLSGNRLNPNFEFSSLAEGTKIIAALDGVVGFVKQQGDSGDYEVFLQPSEGSIWTVGYDHLTNVTVKQGDRVKVGDILGEPAKQNNGLRRFELQVNKDTGGVSTHICPSTLVAASVNETMLADLQTMENAWETFSKKDLYRLEDQRPVGCLSQTLTPQQAEGR